MHFGYDYEESQDYSKLPGFEKLTEEQRRHVHAEYERGYNSAKHMGLKVAMGKAHETAKRALGECLADGPALQEQPVPPSIFSGLENCR